MTATLYSLKVVEEITVCDLCTQLLSEKKVFSYEILCMVQTRKM